MILHLLCIGLTAAGLSLPAEMPGQAIPRCDSARCLRFDMGSGNVEPGYIKVTGNMTYTPERGYGFVSGTPVLDIDRGGRDALLRNFCTSAGPFFFVATLHLNWDNRLTASF